MSQQLIIGIDPGTTTAYAILDMMGNIVAIESSKGKGLDAVIRETTARGKPMAVGTDRMKCPQMVSRFAARTGAAKVIPDYDVPETEKNSLTQSRETRNSHQKDALAAAMVAYKHYEPLLQRVRKFLRKQGKEELADEVAGIVVQKKISIDKALRIAELPLVPAH